MGDGGFTIDDLGPQEVVVEYVCNYTSVITGTTSQVRTKPSEVAAIPTQQGGGYLVQVRVRSLVVQLALVGAGHLAEKRLSVAVQLVLESGLTGSCTMSC